MLRLVTEFCLFLELGLCMGCTSYPILSFSLPMEKEKKKKELYDCNPNLHHERSVGFIGNCSLGILPVEQ